MKRFAIALATLVIATGLSPVASSLAAQEYGQFSQPTPPPPDQAQGQAQLNYPDQSSNQSAPDGSNQSEQTDTSAQPGVARASYIHGDVAEQRGDNSDNVPVTLNTPIEAGDRVTTSNDGRAEVQLDYADQLRLSGGATVKIASLNRQNIQVQIGGGLTTYSVLPGSEASSEIDTPNASLHPNGQGDYRILVNSDAETKIIVRSGSAEVSTPQGSTHVDAGQMITVAGTDDPQYRVDAAPGRDDWDSWNTDRDRRVQSAQSTRDTGRYTTGAEDLDGYGEWSEVPDYGNVWFPSNGPDWAPYRDGSWVYEPYYGWTWVSYEPWGWAPYHYGRWFVYGGRWGWWPGPVYSPGFYPVWAPAYVSFFGWGGGGFGVGFGFGGGFGRVGWLPIGPGDWYHPWYGRFGGRVNVVDIHNFNTIHEGFGPLHGLNGRQFSNVHDAFVNDRVRGGISSMNGSEFGHGRVSMNQARVSQAEFNQSRLATGRSPMTPSRGSFSATGREANMSSFHNVPPSSQRFFTPNRGGNFANTNSGGNAASRQQTPFSADRNSTRTARPAPQEMGNRSQGFSQQSGSARPGWHTFTPPSSASGNRGGQQGFNQNRGGQPAQGFNQNRGTENRSMNNGPTNEARPNNGSNGGNWQRFTPPSRQPQPQQQERGFSRGSSGPNSRPTLNMRQPIVTPRGSEQGGQRGNFNGPRGGYQSGGPTQRGGNFSAPRGSGNAGGFSGPRGGGNSGGFSGPRGGGGSAPHGGNGGGGGGSHSGGGGGSHGGRR